MLRMYGLIGLSAGVLNKKHRTLEDRIRCAKI